MMTTASQTAAGSEQWPAWAKALLIAMGVLALMLVPPWVFMWTLMAGACAPMMKMMR
jgi:hypothetical protein